MPEWQITQLSIGAEFLSYPDDIALAAKPGSCTMMSLPIDLTGQNTHP